MKYSLFINPLKPVCAEEIALGLSEILGQSFCSVTVVIPERGRHRRKWNTSECAESDGTAPVDLVLAERRTHRKTRLTIPGKRFLVEFDH